MMRFICLALALAHGAPGTDAVAVVDGRAVPAAIHRMFVRNAREAFGLDPATPEGRRGLALVHEDVLAALVDRALIVGEVERRGLRVTPEQLAEAERRAIAGFGGEARYDAYLADHELTRAGYREVLWSELCAEVLRADLARGIAVPQADVDAYYARHAGEAAFRRPALVTASHVLVEARPGLAADEAERRRRKAEAVRRRAEAGDDFGALAREVSDDPATRARGGDLGTFAHGTHTRVFDDAAFALRPGTVAVIRTEYGFHVMKVTAREHARALTLAEAAPEIRRRLFAAREAKALAGWLARARRAATIRTVCGSARLVGN
jgi:peptidyl-prolyl cis-trans isomerase C